MRKQTHAKKRKAVSPKRKVAKKAQRNIRGGAGAVVIQPTIDKFNIGTPDEPNIVIRFNPGMVILPRGDLTGEQKTIIIGKPL